MQAQADAGTLPEPLALLPVIGALLQQRAAERGAIELGTPEQEVEAGPGRRLDAGAARRPAGRGLERADLAAHRPVRRRAHARRRRRHAAHAAAGPARGRRPAAAARARARRRLAGGRRPRRGDRRRSIPPGPGTPPSSRRRSPCCAAPPTRRSTARRPSSRGTRASAAPYAHVTAPLRRLVDRFGTEVCLALAAGAEPAPELRAALPELPGAHGRLRPAHPRGRARRRRRRPRPGCCAAARARRSPPWWSTPRTARAPWCSTTSPSAAAAPARGCAGHAGQRPARGGRRRRAHGPVRPRHDARAVPHLPAAGLRDDGLRRDERAGRGHRRGQPRPGLPRLPGPAGGARRRPGGDRHRRRPVPARARAARSCARRSPSTCSGSAGSTTTRPTRCW